MRHLSLLYFWNQTKKRNIVSHLLPLEISRIKTLLSNLHPRKDQSINRCINHLCLTTKRAPKSIRLRKRINHLFSHSSPRKQHLRTGTGERRINKAKRCITYKTGDPQILTTTICIIRATAFPNGRDEAIFHREDQYCTFPLIGSKPLFTGIRYRGTANTGLDL